MADIQEYLSSGILELYVYGALSEKESREVTAMLRKYPEVEKEVEEIEFALQQLAKGVAPSNPEALLSSLKAKLSARTSTTTPPTGGATRKEKPSRSITWITYTGWAASLVLLIGLFFLFQQNAGLRKSLTQAKTKNSIIQQQIVQLRQETENTKQILAAIRDNNVSRIPLQSQEVAPDAYATVYWNTSENTAYIDAQGLPEPPRGKVYQVWSLTMQPLTPTSIGLLDNFETSDNRIFTLENPNQSEAFGITLEDEGGSETPAMEQLYVLGTVATP